MQDKHIQEKLSAYLNHELPKDERQAIGEHLLQCENCRVEHDEIKLGAALATHLQRADAPESVWTEIENALDGNKRAKAAAVPYFSFLSLRGLSTAAAALLICLGLITAIYIGFFRNKPQEIAVNTPAENPNSNAVTPEIISKPVEIAANQNTNAQISSNANSNVQTAPPNENSNVRILPKVNPNPKIRPNPNKPDETLTAQNNLPSWNVETISGAPTAGNRAIAENGKLVVGQFLETDANSRARVQVANIGQVEIAPNSRVQLVTTHSTEHRLSLERGLLKAKILAPPRLFIVDTPSAVAVDLGCEYTLEVDKDGSSKLHVTSGYVALEKDGRESIVPAGAFCLTKRGKGLGTPFSEDASSAFQNALVRFDFQNGGSASVQEIIKESNFYDTLSLWHLLSRTQKNDREKVFDALAKYVQPPVGTTREGILRLDKKMLDQWWTEIENLWFE
jgi:hypothetical protein